jgi:quinohemoprotein ethanol dehydrogenase
MTVESRHPSGALRYAAYLILWLALDACHRAPSPPVPTLIGPLGVVDANRTSAAREPGQWLTTGRDASLDYHSPLSDINASNVAQLGFAWEYRLGTHRGLEATPVMVDGTLYFSGNFGHVYAVDAVQGREKWAYDPGVDGQWGRYACCDAVNRGVAVWQGKTFVGTSDGYLHAIDAATGHRIWKVDTLVERDAKHPYTISGAPLIAGDDVVIGNSGSDFAGVRGYVAAYDLRDGHLKWRFYTVPRDPKLGAQDQPHLTAAVKTWDPRHRWDEGSGGTVWDGINYDADLKLVYVGTANGAPYNIKGDGGQGGDDLYAASILAIHEDTGTLAWSFQPTPGDRWDYDSTAKMVFADLDLGRGPRKVLMQANKNGYFYVIDRASGEVLAAHNYAYVNWTLGLDPVTHRPRSNPAAEYATKPRLIYPGQAGAHNWQPMSYDSNSKLAYIPVIEQPMVYVETTERPAGLIEGMFTVPGVVPEGYIPADLRSLYGTLPSLKSLAKEVSAPVASRGRVRAIDVTSGKIVWDVPSESAWDGGILSTDGNLVFQGDVAGRLNVYAANTGRPLAQIETGTGIMAAPMTYKLSGTQYIAVLAGYGGANTSLTFPTDSAGFHYSNEGRLIVLKLGGGAVPRPDPVDDSPMPRPASPAIGTADGGRGEVLYNRYCARCHVFGRGVLPDLRRISPTTDRLFYDIVLRGLYAPAGMARWDDVLSQADAQAIHDYIMDMAWREYASHKPPANPAAPSQ